MNNPLQTMSSTQMDEQSKIQQHHKNTGCDGSIKKYKDTDGNVKGYFCSCCKDEWLSNAVNINRLPDVECRPVAHHIIPSFCCMQVSDTGNFIQWKNVNEGLKPGDHVSWLRPFMGYWHHAIVEEVTDDCKIEVIEWSTSIHRNTRKSWDPIGNCCYSPMYKAYYPKEVEDQNPPELVLMRARARLENTGYGLFSDNCEHFATFCKTGLHRSNQLHQLKVTFRAWVRRILVSFLHMALIVSFSETIERFAGVQGKHWLGAVLLVVSEFVYLIIAFCVIYRHDTRREEFHGDGEPSKTRACKCASVKAVLQSIILVTFAILANVVLLNCLKKTSWSSAKLTGAEIGLGVAGGMVGNMIGFILFAWIPYSCCRNENPANSSDC